MPETDLMKALTASLGEDAPLEPAETTPDDVKRFALDLLEAYAAAKNEEPETGGIR